MAAITPITSLRSASRIVRTDLDLARLERDKPGHGAAELARRVKAQLPDASLAACRRAADVVLESRLARDTRRGAGGRVSTPSRAFGRAPKSVDSLAERLVEFKRARVLEAFEDAGFRHSRAWAGDTGTFHVGFGAPAASQVATEGWIDYKSHGYRKGIVRESVLITVPADWGIRVRPLDTTPGMLLLDAEQLPTSGSVEVYRAAWARQGRGVSLVVEHGYLARHLPSGTDYHSTHPDPEKALTGLRRKLTAQGISPAEREARAAHAAGRRVEQIGRIVERVRRHDLGALGDVRVTRRDSLRAGNCIPGTDAFIERYFPDDDPDEGVTIATIAARLGGADLASLAGVDLTLARQLAAACLVSIRRDRNARRALA